MPRQQVHTSPALGSPAVVTGVESGLAVHVLTDASNSHQDERVCQTVLNPTSAGLSFHQTGIPLAESMMRIRRVRGICLGRMPIFTKTVSIEEPIQRASADTE